MIRTLVIQRNGTSISQQAVLTTLTAMPLTELTLGAGGAITHLSEAAKEWEEVLVKTEAVLGNGQR